MALRLTEAQVGLLKVDNVNSRTANTALYITGGSTVYLSSASNSSLIMRMGEEEVARVSAKGNFIIGADDVTTTDYKLKVTGATGFNSGHLYLTGASASSSTAGTTQLVFGEPGNNHVVVSSNTKALVINPTTTTTTNQIVLYLDQHSLFPSGIKTASTTNSTSATTGSIITSGGIGVGKNIFSTGRYTSNQAGARYIVNNNTLNGWFGFSENGESFGVYDVTNGYYLIKNTTKTTGGGVSLGAAAQHTTVLGNLTVDKNTTLSGTLTHIGQYFYKSGDATMKFYPQTNTTYENESIAIQTCFDNQDGSSSAYVTSHENRCNLLLQPRGGQVYIGVNHTTLGDATNSLIVGGNATITNLLTTGSGSSHYGIKVGDTYINAINDNLILQNNGAIRFGADSWDWNVWAGLKYDSTNKNIYLGLADGSIFTANANQSGGTLALPGIRYFSVNGKRVIDAVDTWLRINDGSAFTAGIYMGSSLVRTDGQFQVGSGGSAFYAKSDGTGYFKSNLKVDGKLIMTGNIAYTNGTNQYDVIKFVTGDVNGAGLVLGGGGVVIIGSGESASNFQGSSGANVAGSTETTYITSDNGIEFYTNCQTIGNRVGVILNVSRHFYPNANNTGSLGTSSYKWSTGYFYGSVNAGSVWAAHQTGGESDIGVSFASGKNLYLYANNSTGSRGLYDSTKGSVISVTNSAASFYGNASTADALRSPNNSTLAYLDWTGQQTSCTWFATWDDTTYTGKPTVRAMSATNMRQNLGTLSSTLANGYQGMGRPDGNTTDWIRTTENGIIPYSSDGTNGKSSLGTSTWPFATVHAKAFKGNADTASKWLNARTITIGKDYAGSVSIDGSANKTLDITAYKVTAGGNNTNTYPWRRIAYISNASGGYSDYDCILDIRATYDSTRFGRIKISYRTNNTSTSAAISCHARWIYRSGFSLSDLVIASWGASGQACYADVFLNCGGSWPRLEINQVYGERKWTLVTSSEATDAASRTEAYTTVAAAGTELHSKPYHGTWNSEDAPITVNYSNSTGSVAWANVTGKPGFNYLPLAGGTMTGNINFNSLGSNYIGQGAKDASPTVGGALCNLVISSWNGISFTTACSSTYQNKTAIGFDCRTGTIRAAAVHGAVWNDYAEYRTGETTEAGRVVKETKEGILKITTQRLEPGCEIISDTFGFSIGETENSKTPIAAAGRVLAYPFEDRNSYELGQAVCSGPNGTISKMTREEIMMYPERIIGTVSEIPNYETWGSGDVPVNGRIWIRIR